MNAAGGSTTYFVSHHHEHLHATLEEPLRVSSKHDAITKNTDRANVKSQRTFDTDDIDSDSDYQCEDDADSHDDLGESEPEVEEWRLHATEPREGLYLHEMRRQRGRMDEHEVRWVRKYIKAQRVWTSRTGRSIDEFYIPGIVREMKNSRSVQRNRLRKLDQEEKEEEANVLLVVGSSRLEILMFLAAIMFVCLSFGVQLYASKHETLSE